MTSLISEKSWRNIHNSLGAKIVTIGDFSRNNRLSQLRLTTLVRPVLGRSLLTNHRMPYSINECTTKKRHDLLQSIPVHHYSQRNGLAMSKEKRIMKFKDPASSAKDLLMTESPSWEPHSTVSELIDSLIAWQSLDHIIQPSHYGTDVIVWIVENVLLNIYTKC